MGLEKELALVCNPKRTFFIIFYCRKRLNSEILFIFAIETIMGEYMSTELMKQQIADYFKTQPVLKAWLFGSFARGEETPESDVDILFVPYMSGHFSLFTLGGMYMDLKDLLGREIDLVPEGSLLPFAQETAEQDKKLIYERTSQEQESS